MVDLPGTLGFLCGPSLEILVDTLEKRPKHHCGSFDVPGGTGWRLGNFGLTGKRHVRNPTVPTIHGGSVREEQSSELHKSGAASLSQERMTQWWAFDHDVVEPVQLRDQPKNCTQLCLETSK